MPDIEAPESPKADSEQEAVIVTKDWGRTMVIGDPTREEWIQSDTLPAFNLEKFR